MKVGDLIKATDSQQYGIIIKITKLSLFIYWTKGYKMGYNKHNYYKYFEVINENRK